MLKRNLIGFFVSLFTASTAVAGNGPNGYPKEPVRFIVAFAPGGGTDLVARLVAAELSKRIGANIVVENKGGASGTIAAQHVARAAPDGYTLLVGGSGPMVFNPIMYDNLPYDPAKDFEHVTILGSYPIVFVAGREQPFNTLRELIAYARANPGKLNYGSAGASFQVPTEYFAAVTGISITHVPYKGTALAAQAMMAGDIQLLSADVGPGAPLVISGRAKALAVTSAQRNPILLDVPTVREAGINDFDFSLYSAIAAPRGTPAEIVKYLQEQLHDTLHSPEVSERLKQMGIKPEGMPSGEAVARYKREIAHFKPLVERLGLKAN